MESSDFVREQGAHNSWKYASVYNNGQEKAMVYI
jgi:hypothetical protein